MSVAPHKVEAAARPRPPIAILIAIAAIGPLALNIFVPSMPGMQQVFAVDYGTIQLTVTLYLFGTAIAQLFYGPLSDRFGRRPVLLAGLVLFLVSSLAAALATTITFLLIARTFQAVGGCAGLVLSRAIVRDMHNREKSASIIGYVTMGMVVVPMIAPLMGGFLEDWFDWRAGFLLVAAIGVMVLAASLMTLHETNLELRPLPGVAGAMLSYRSLVRSPEYCGYTLNASFSSAAFFSFLAGGPFVTVQLMGHPPTTYGLFFVLIAFGYMAGNLLTGRMAERIGTDRMIRIGTSISLIAVIAMLAFALSGPPTLLTVFVPMGIMTFGNGLSLPNAMAGAVSVDPRIAGAAAGLVGFLQMLVASSATLLVGYMQEDSVLPMVLVIFVATVIAFVSHAYTQRRARRRPLEPLEASPANPTQAE